MSQPCASLYNNPSGRILFYFFKTSTRITTYVQRGGCLLYIFLTYISAPEPPQVKDLDWHTLLKKEPLRQIMSITPFFFLIQDFFIFVVQSLYLSLSKRGPHRTAWWTMSNTTLTAGFFFSVFLFVNDITVGEFLGIFPLLQPEAFQATLFQWVIRLLPASQLRK